MRRGSESERERQGAATRGAVRAAGMAMVFGIAFMLMIDGLLPTTTASDRVGLFTTALMVVVAGILWFFFIPRLWFGPSRVLLAATVSQTVLLALVAQTGGVQGRYLPYLALPMIALVMAGRPRQSAGLGAYTIAGVVAIAARQAEAGDAVAVRDAGISTLLYLLTLTGFGAAVARATGRLRDGLADRAAALAEEKDVVSLLAETDELTGLANRRRLHAHLTQMLGAAATQGAISVIAFDLDGLKAVNDTQGHHAGDELLRRFAILLQRATRGRDIAARVGGDEFVMALPGTTAEGAAALGRRLEEMADREGRVSYPIRFSYGAAQYERGDSPSRVLERADAALYDAKSRLTRA